MRCRICNAELRGSDRCPDCGQRAAGPIRPAFEAKREKPEATVGIATGEVLAGRYEVREEIGTSLLARLYRAKDRSTGAKVVLRVIHAGLITSRDEREATQKALRAAVGVEGRHLCPMIDVGEHGERLFAVEPAVDAVPLARVLRHRRARGETFAPREVLPVVAQSAAALASIAGGRAHGSIDPSVVLVHADGLRLVGAHVATALPADAMARATRNANVSALAYLAPEVRAGARPTAASDRYAIAAIACECLTGRPALSSREDGDDDTDRDTSRAPPDKSGARLPEALRRTLMRCLEPIADERASTLAELISELASTAGLGVPSLADASLSDGAPDGEDDDDHDDAAAADDEPKAPGDDDKTKVTPAAAAAPAPVVRKPAGDDDTTAPHAAISVDPSAPTQEERIPDELVIGGAAADRDAKPKVVARRPAGAAAEGTAEIELDQIIEEPIASARSRGGAAGAKPIASTPAPSTKSPTAARASPQDAQKKGVSAAPAAKVPSPASTRPLADRKQSGSSSIPSLGGAGRKSPSLPSLAVPLTNPKSASSAPAAGALSASGSRSIPMTTSGSIPVDLDALDLASMPTNGARAIDDGPNGDGDAPVPSLLSAARRHASSRPAMRAATSEPPPRAQAQALVQAQHPAPQIVTATASGRHVVVPDGVIGIPRVQPPSGEHAIATPSEVLFDDSHRPRPNTRQGDPTRTEIYDRATHDVGPEPEAPKKGSRWFVWGAALLALVILAVGAVIYLQRRDYAERRREIELQMQTRPRGESP